MGAVDFAGDAQIWDFRGGGEAIAGVPFWASCPSAGDFGR